MKPKYPLRAFDGATTADVSLLIVPSGAIGSNGNVTIGGVKVYRALLTQIDTDAPVATVLENTLGGEVVWTYSNTGRYTATLAGAFTESKTFVKIGQCSSNGALTGFSSSSQDGADILHVRTVAIIDLSTSVDGLLLANAIEILVYP